MPDITDTSKALFVDFAQDAGNWNGMPLIGGNVMITNAKADRGNLTQLKKAGLVETEYDSFERLTWLTFTEDGERYAIELGIDLGSNLLKINWAHFHELIVLTDIEGISRLSGTAENGAKWIQFEVDYLAEQTEGECSICRKSLVDGWMCLDGGDEVCSSHIKLIR